ncbi:MAG: hypothetical protein AAGD01_19635 [Acidobacteriota bacterium]
MSSGASAPFRRRERDEVLRSFRAFGAVTAEVARPLHELGLGRTSMVERLIARGVVVEEGGACWLNERREASFARQRRRRRVLAVLLAAIALIALSLTLF